jgi:hypothetical protein
LIRPQTWLPHAILFSEWSIPKNSSSLKSLGQMYRNLVGSIYGRFRGEYLSEIDQPETRIGYGFHVY